MSELGRRELLTHLGAAAALAGLGACTRAPREEIVPYVVAPPEVTPGRARFYATASTLDGYAIGVLAESHEGRPTKIEGNPDHPASLGATDAFAQASVLSLYDPSRAKAATTSFERIRDAMTSGPWTARQGEGLHIVLEPSSSPTVAALVNALYTRWPRASLWFHAPGSPVNAWEGARIAFGRVVEPRLDLAKADVVLSLDADFVVRGPASLRLARQLADGRGRNRLYVVEPLLTVTGMSADHRLAVRAGDVGAVASAIAAAIGVRETSNALRASNVEPRDWIAAVGADLARHRGRSIVIAGADQPPAVHALAHAMNAALDAPVAYAMSPILDAGSPRHDLAGLRDALAAGAVDTLVVCGPDLAYTGDPRLKASLARARQSIVLGSHEGQACTYFVPRAHALEAWGDARAFDGTVTVIQPLIEPLYGGRTEIDLLAPYAGRATASAHDLVRERFADEKAWRRALRRGVVDGTAFPVLDLAVDTKAVLGALTPREPRPRVEGLVRLDAQMHDGRFAKNAWLLERPDPITKLTWENAATLAPRTAAREGIADGDELEIESGGARIRIPACIVDGQAEDTVGITLGWGKDGFGADAYVLGARAFDARIRKTGEKRELARTQIEHGLHGREDAILGPRKEKRALTLYGRPAGAAKAQWGMAIDLARCTGCSVCVVACQAENNVPTVGRDGVLMGRAMHWLRIDTYRTETRTVPQPMLCQHCEKAPCEYVCPVNATVHSPDGLNEQVYNRCIGTRFCSNNCPYKVRRFNWFDFHRHEERVERLVHNPDVTVRERGVMEKCTLCVQRIRAHEIERDRGESPPPPMTACQQACPSAAIVFGDLHDRDSAVRKLHADERAFAALGELGTEPRVRYLARRRVPNPELG